MYKNIDILTKANTCSDYCNNIDVEPKIYGRTYSILYGPRREKHGLRGLGQSQFQTDLLSYRRYLEN